MKKRIYKKVVKRFEDDYQCDLDYYGVNPKLPTSRGREMKRSEFLACLYRIMDAEMDYAYARTYGIYSPWSYGR